MQELNWELGWWKQKNRTVRIVSFTRSRFLTFIVLSFTKVREFWNVQGTALKFSERRNENLLDLNKWAAINNVKVKQTNQAYFKWTPLAQHRLLWTRDFLFRLSRQVDENKDEMREIVISYDFVSFTATETTKILKERWIISWQQQQRLRFDFLIADFITLRFVRTRWRNKSSKLFRLV